MPTSNEIRKRIADVKGGGQDQVRREFFRSLHAYTERDTIVYASAFASRKGINVPGFVLSIVLEDIQGFMSVLHGLKGPKLDLILHSPGGSSEAAEQIVTYLRSKYRHIRAIIPQNAMSAATMIACACDEIVMGKHSALGPVDPQITLPTATGPFTAPAHAILEEFERAKQEVIEDQRTAPLWVSRIEAYPQGLLSMCENAIERSVSLVGEWLNRYMFRDREQRGDGIAEWLGANEHGSHGKPLGIEALRARGLEITSMEDDQELQEKVLSLFHATAVTFEVSNCMKIFENHLGKGAYLNVQLAPPSPPPPTAESPT